MHGVPDGNSLAEDRTLPAAERVFEFFLNQSRLGKVEVEVTPAQNLDPEAEYEVIIRGAVRTLGSLADGSQAQLGTDVRFTFIVGPGPIPLDEIKENFDSIATLVRFVESKR